MVTEPSVREGNQTYRIYSNMHHVCYLLVVVIRVYVLNQTVQALKAEQMFESKYRNVDANSQIIHSHVSMRLLHFGAGKSG